ncbi:hypothetical protein D915_003168 [Fasciola hepatica]|uniref:Uncharacterized protein n=1 Tax=Fasciola hepatica TaxID=6192 RepID=A0A4E0RE61_FASHE|nr:hypothetical protein D915_003168 [Fasciola hepatica]
MESINFEQSLNEIIHQKNRLSIQERVWLLDEHITSLEKILLPDFFGALTLDNGSCSKLNTQTLNHFSMEVDRLQKMLSNVTGFTPITQDQNNAA